MNKRNESTSVHSAPLQSPENYLVQGFRSNDVEEKKCLGCGGIFEKSKKYFKIDKRWAGGSFISRCHTCENKRHLGDAYKKRVRVIDSLGGPICSHCGLTGQPYRFYDIDHKVPRLRHTSGYHKVPEELKKLENLQVLCPNCHRTKTITDSKNHPWGRKKKSL